MFGNAPASDLSPRMASVGASPQPSWEDAEQELAADCGDDFDARMDRCAFWGRVAGAHRGVSDFRIRVKPSEFHQTDELLVVVRDGDLRSALNAVRDWIHTRRSAAADLKAAAVGACVGSPRTPADPLPSAVPHETGKEVDRDGPG